MFTGQAFSLDDLIVVTYCALDDALKDAGILARKGKLIPRRGSAPDVDDREILCLAVLQELLGYESDNSFYLWFENNPTMKNNFPRRLSRQNYADRRTLLSPLIEKLCVQFCKSAGEEAPPFSSSIPTPSKSAASFARVVRPGLAAWRKPATAIRSGSASTPCANT